MKCPKCEEGTLVGIRFKTTGKRANICNFCGTLWNFGEMITATTGMMFTSYQRGIEQEYMVDEMNAKDQDHRKPVEQAHFR